MNRSALVFGVSAAACALAFLAVGEREASACGGCFHPPTQVASDITDERMLLSVSTTQTTLYDQIRYSGSPTSFAWVLPIHGTVNVGLSADVLFDSVDELTATQIQAPIQQCPGVPQSCQGQGGGFGASVPAAGGPNGSVTVTKAQNVGPYATVQLHATDSSALNNWLATNGFNIPTDVLPVIDEYVKEGFDFLAMKLLPDQGVQSMRPVRVSTTGAAFSLPLRMAAIGTGATVGITIWVVSDGRYEPQNFPFYHIEDSELVWDFDPKVNASNYTTLRAAKESALGGKGWEIESSIALNEQTITNVILSGGVYFNGGGQGGVGPAAPVSDPSTDYLPVGDPDAGTDGGATETAEQVRTDDINALFTGMTGPNVRITRMRSDISHAAMTADFILQASADQSELSNIRNVTNSINLTCPIYSGCTVVGQGTPAQAAASASGTRGCAAATQSSKEPVTMFAALGGMFAIVAMRVARARRKRSSTKG
jgi:hypothetical protein